MNAPDDSHFRFIGRPIPRKEDGRLAKAASAAQREQAE
jgi:hypothetical protein